MRPIKLTISAFGPYAKEQVISMDLLGDAGVYLITGDTGAGKTTIFDAITYALYGEASGEHRETTMFRSKYADKETTSFVELEFVLRGEHYVVKRIPEYERPKTRGEGVTKQKAEATLLLPNSNVPITKPTEVTKAIVSLLGLDRKQFTQLAMVAQGEFLKLLLAKTEERSKIFRDIFKTTPYLLLQENIKKEANALSRTWEDNRKTLYHHMDEVCAKPGHAMELELLDMKKNKEAYLLQDVLRTIEKIIESDENEKNNVLLELKKIENRLEQVNEQLGVGKSLLNAKKDLEENEKRLEEERKHFQMCQEKLEECKKMEKRREELVVLIETQKQKLTSYEEWDTLGKTVLDFQKKIKKGQQWILKAGDEEAQLKEQILLEKEKKEGLKEVDVKRVFYEKQLESVLEKRTRLKKLSDRNQDYMKKQASLGEIQIKFKEENASYLAQCKNYQNLEQLFFKEQAGILAKDLEENMPCPVCGSLHHPKLAPLLPEAPSEEKVKQEKMRLEKKRGEVEELSKEVNASSKELELLQREILEQAQEILGISTWEEVKEAGTTCANQMKEEILEMKKQVEFYQGKELERREVEERIPKLEEQYAKLVEERNLQEKLLLEQTILEKSTKEKQDTMRKLMEYSSIDEAKTAITKLEQEKQSIERDREQSEEAYAGSKQKIVSYETKNNELKKLVEQRDEINVEHLQQEHLQLCQEKEVKDKEKEDISIRISKNTGAKTSIEKQRKKLSCLEEKMTWLKALSDTANGTVAGKDKIMLETYVQMQYFERVLQRANVRLMNMSGGQYELQRRTEAENQRSQSGLELNVLDHYNGSTRSVKTLSGGEAFQASLSLALGLADEVREYAGGIQMDTMFVDEGFGSLDEEALSQAIKTLHGLAEGKRLVGIISHVPDLKNRIDKQIVVKKERESGSRVTIVT